MEALRAVHEVAPESVTQSLGLALENVNGVTCSASRAEPGILINRCFGLGKQQPATEKAITNVLQFYLDQGVGEFFLHLTPECQPVNIHELLMHSGMAKSRGWMKFTRDALPAVARSESLTIKKIGSEHAEAFAQIVAPCFDMTEVSIPLLSAIVDHPEWHVYVGFEGDIPVATGALFARQGMGYYDWAATHADYRRKGYQGEVLAHLINDAIAMGCKTLVTTTGEAVAGDPQHSYNNILRYGFREDYLRENWVPLEDGTS